MLSIKEFVILLCAIYISFSLQAQPKATSNLTFTSIPDRWDRGFPLGNGMLGVLVWQNNGMLRLSVDRADLWDLRPTADIEKYTYKWAFQQRLKGDFDTVWKVADVPYDRDAAPTKIPGAAIEFDISSLGEIESATLNIATAICTITWKNGVVFRTFVDATQPLARYKWEGLSSVPFLKSPAYTGNNNTENKNQVVGGSDLRRLGYEDGKIISKKNMTIYQQKAWGTLTYEAAVIFKQTKSGSEGCFTITSHYGDKTEKPAASAIVKKAIKTNFDPSASNHKQWWLSFWNRSSIELPDPLLEKQYYLEMYKFGAASRKGSPPITLQAVWTADNGKLPPWKGDLHNDLNTQLSYWPSYTGNFLEEGSVFTDWLWEHKPTFESYAVKVFDAKGLNVPGVSTLEGMPMGGWHMYSLSPTVGAWLSQNFYLQWRYSMDKNFLETRAYPWFSATATFLEQVTELKNGIRSLPMSSSPEFKDNSMEAWFLTMTNYDLALCHFAFEKAAELATELGLTKEAEHWQSILAQFGDYDIDETGGLSIAKNFPLNESHRHFSHLMAFHPLGLLDYNSNTDKEIINQSIARLEKNGTSQWCGYSFSWLANIYARMYRGDDAVRALQTFASCFCSPNSFHLNGDQCKAGHSSYTYDPFTLEGNFAFAAGVQEMLLQSHNGLIRIFPAVPAEWKNISFRNLRAEGAFLISASKENGVIDSFTIHSIEGGIAEIQLPFPTFYIGSSEKMQRMESNDRKKIVLKFEKGGKAVIRNGYE
ncbi:MAG: glycosyl hydrolase family 95 catalytic domain-containing protein [Bacteroidales bacterium]